MKFHKDILIIDFEGRKSPVQIGAVLLDRDTLIEKSCLSSYIYAELDGYISPVSGITQEMINDAPSKAVVGQQIYDMFGTDIMLSSWVADLDISHFKSIMIAAGKSFSDYDYHVLDIWCLAYVYALQQGYSGSVRSEELFHFFDVKPRDLHDALEDCRIAADILRKIATKS